MNINPEYENTNRAGINYIRSKLTEGGDMNIMLKGESLSGKSWIANEVYNAVQGGVKRKLTANEIVSKYDHYKFSNFSDSTEHLRQLKALQFMPILIIDEIGGEFSLGKTGIEFLRSFIENRLDFIGRNRSLNVDFPERIVTVFTTRLSGRELTDRYGSKVGRGVSAKMQIITIKGIPLTYEVITPDGITKKEII